MSKLLGDEATKTNLDVCSTAFSIAAAAAVDWYAFALVS
jgi:hypothetical protein